MKKKIFYGVGIFFGAWVVFIGVMSFLEWRNETKFERNRAKLDKMVEEREKELAEDTLGGKTPQETLAMFIEAVEKVDYELASKYFVAERQEEELKSLQESPIENISNVMEILKKAKSWRSSQEDKIFIMEIELDKLPALFISFIKYPSGNWKIDEI